MLILSCFSSFLNYLLSFIDINAIPNKEFGGYEFLAYYYVSWALAVPDKVDSLGLPFKSAYQSARKLFESKK